MFSPFDLLLELIHGFSGRKEPRPFQKADEPVGNEEDHGTDGCTDDDQVKCSLSPDQPQDTLNELDHDCSQERTPEGSDASEERHDDHEVRELTTEDAIGVDVGDPVSIDATQEFQGKRRSSRRPSS